LVYGAVRLCDKDKVDSLLFIFLQINLIK